jgi:hypothetical protein
LRSACAKGVSASATASPGKDADGELELLRIEPQRRKGIVGLPVAIPLTGSLCSPPLPHRGSGWGEGAGLIQCSRETTSLVIHRRALRDRCGDDAHEDPQSQHEAGSNSR